MKLKKLGSVIFDTTIYKLACICVFMLVPSYVLCYVSKYVSVILLLWGATILFKDLIGQRNMFKQTGSLLLLLFCIGYVITLILYAKNDIVSTIHVFCWAIVEFFLLFAIERQKKMNVEMLAQDLYKINVVVSAVALLSGIASLMVFFTKTSVIMPDPEGLNAFWSMGIINGRNSGIFNNAIPCGNAMFIGCAAAAYNLVAGPRRKVAGRIFYGLTFLVSLMVTMTTLTRTYVYGIYVFTFVAAFYGSYQHWMKNGKQLKRFAIAVAVALAVTGACAGLAEAGKWAMVKAVEDVPMNNIIVGVDDFANNPTTPADTEQNISSTEPDISAIEQDIANKFGLQTDVNLEREELDRLPNFLYPRDEIWKVALQVIPHSPVFGFTSGNRESASVEFGTTDYRVTRWPTGIPTYHNAYFDIAVSAGLLGLGLILAFLAVQIVRTLRVMFTKRLEVGQSSIRFALGTAVGYLATHVLISCMLLGVLVFTNVSVCIYFWVIIGYISRINDIALQDQERPNFLERLLKKK